jgi:hypothetical protein
VFDFRSGDDARLHSVLALYGWTGRYGDDGNLIGLLGEVYVTTRPHTFADGTTALIVSSCLGTVGAMAS